MKIPILEKINKKIGIDLGSSRTRIWEVGTGLVLDEPTCIAFDVRNKSVLAIGEQAAEMMGRVGTHIEVLFPVADGEIYDRGATQTLLKLFLKQAVGSVTVYNPIIMVNCSAGATQASKEVLIQTMYNLGAGEVYTISEPLAASIGAGVPIADASGSFILHIGAATAEAVIISLGSSIVSQSSKYAGQYFTDSLRVFAKRELDLKMSQRTAENIKKELVSLDKNTQQEQLIAGQDVIDESPKELRITSAEVYQHTIDYLELVSDLVTELLAKMPPELAVDIIDKGLLLTGGTAKLVGIETFFIEKLGIPVSVVDDADTAVISGIGQALEHLDLFKKSLVYQE